MRNPIVSIVVPIFNCKRYLTECIDSVLMQTFTDWELLLIDDGSTDDSGNICDEYKLKDTRISVYHKTNGGVSSARNFGLDKAVGKYLIFLDSDDFWIDKDFLKQFVDTAESNNLDVLRGEYHRVRMSSRNFYDLNERNITTENLFLDSFEMMKIINGDFFSILFLFRKEVLNNIRYDEYLVYQEDTDFLVRLFSKELRCGYTPLYFYAYRQHNENVSFKPLKEHIINAFSMCDRFHKYAQRVHDKRLAGYYLSKAVKSYLITLEMLSYSQYLCKYNSIDDVVKLVQLRQRVYQWNKRLDKRFFYPTIYVSPLLGIRIYQLKRFIGNGLRKIGFRK